MAFYFTTAPAIGTAGSPTGGQNGDYYCDANYGNGEACWELDLMEANQYVVQSTVHKCNQEPGTFTTNCDSGGCGTNSYKQDINGMCPNSSCIINTLKEFTFSVSFSTLNSVPMHVTMTQASDDDSGDVHTFGYDVCGDDKYLSMMNVAYEYGMVMIMSYWGDDFDQMSWLDSMTGCSGDCDTTGVAIFSDIRVTY